MKSPIETQNDAMDRAPVNPDITDYIPATERVSLPMDDLARGSAAAHLVHFDPEKDTSPVDRLIEKGLADQIEGLGGEC